MIEDAIKKSPHPEVLDAVEPRRIHTPKQNMRKAAALRGV
jgi:hypothetical protein